MRVRELTIHTVPVEVWRFLKLLSAFWPDAPDCVVERDRDLLRDRDMVLVVIRRARNKDPRRSDRVSMNRDPMAQFTHEVIFKTGESVIIRRVTKIR